MYVTSMVEEDICIEKTALRYDGRVISRLLVSFNGTFTHTRSSTVYLKSTGLRFGPKKGSCFYLQHQKLNLNVAISSNAICNII